MPMFSVWESTVADVSGPEYVVDIAGLLAIAASKPRISRMRLSAMTCEAAYLQNVRLVCEEDPGGSRLAKGALNC